jgi:UDP-2,3-diacylglucosamine hydrolase
MWFGLTWAKKSMENHRLNGVDKYLGEDKEFQVIYAKEYLKSHPDINYFMFGHRHIELDLMLTHSCRLMILGDWITHYTYAVFDGKTLTMHNYLEGGDNK